MIKLTIALALCLSFLLPHSVNSESELEKQLSVEEILQKASEALSGISDAKMSAKHFDADGRLIIEELIEYKRPGMYRSDWH